MNHTQRWMLAAFVALGVIGVVNFVVVLSDGEPVVGLPVMAPVVAVQLGLLIAIMRT